MHTRAPPVRRGSCPGSRGRGRHDRLAGVHQGAHTSMTAWRVYGSPLIAQGYRAAVRNAVALDACLCISLGMKRGPAHMPRATAPRGFVAMRLCEAKAMSRAGRSLDVRSRRRSIGAGTFTPRVRACCDHDASPCALRSLCTTCVPQSAVPRLAHMNRRTGQVLTCNALCTNCTATSVLTPAAGLPVLPSYGGAEHGGRLCTADAV